MPVISRFILVGIKETISSFRRLAYAFLVILFFSLNTAPVLAQSHPPDLNPEDLHSIYNDTVWYKTGGNCGGDTSTANRIIWPFETKSESQYNRVDQGWDIQDKAGTAIYAIAPGKIHVF